MTEELSLWTERFADLHAKPSQLKRQKSATSIPIRSEHLDISSSSVAIKDYAVSLDSCTCIDFQRRRLPCKHMYRLAHELKMFDLGVECPHGAYPPQDKSKRVCDPERAAITARLVSLSADAQKAYCEILRAHASSDKSSIKGCVLLDVDSVLNELLSAGLIKKGKKTKAVTFARYYQWTAHIICLHEMNVQYIKSGTDPNDVTLEIIDNNDVVFIHISIPDYIMVHADALYRNTRKKWPRQPDIDEHGIYHPNHPSLRCFHEQIVSKEHVGKFAGVSITYTEQINKLEATIDPADSEYFDGFAWAVPKAFQEALETCYFCVGDILYDNRLAYEDCWADAVRHMKYSIQVKAPGRSQPSASCFKNNWGRSIWIMLTDHISGESERIWTTQGRLYTLLRSGDLAIVKDNSDSPSVPLQSREVLKCLKHPLFKTKAKNYIMNKCGDIDDVVCFMMPYDHSVVLSRIKFLWIKSAFPVGIKPQIYYPSLADLEIASAAAFAPTMRIACYLFEGVPEDKVFDAIKSVLYKPDPNKKTDKDCFRLSAHGILL